MNIKSFILIGVIVFRAVGTVGADEVQSFVVNVDAEWSAKNYQAMRQIIDQRLALHTNDLPALLLKINYYLTIEYHLSMAQSLVPAFTNAIAVANWSSDYMAKVACHAIAEETLDPSDSQSVGVIFGMSSNDLSQVYAASPTNHPLSPLALRVGLVQYPE